MLAIRLQRVGKRNNPAFRLVLMDARRSAKSGDFLEILGSYNPQHEGLLSIKKDQISHWLSKGAQPSDTVHNLLVGEKLIDAPKRNMVAPSKLKKSEEKPAVALTEIAVASASAEQPASEIIENPIEIEKPTEEATAFVAEQPEKKE